MPQLLAASGLRARGGATEDMDLLEMEALGHYLVQEGHLEAVEFNGGGAPVLAAVGIEEHQEPELHWEGRGQGRQPPVKCRKGSVAWFVQRKNEPIYDNAGVTVEQAAYAMMRVKTQGRVGDTVFNDILRVFEKLLPPGNLFPRYAEQFQYMQS